MTEWPITLVSCPDERAANDAMWPAFPRRRKRSAGALSAAGLYMWIVLVAKEQGTRPPAMAETLALNLKNLK